MTEQHKPANDQDILYPIKSVQDSQDVGQPRSTEDSALGANRTGTAGGGDKPGLQLTGGYKLIVLVMCALTAVFLLGARGCSTALADTLHRVPKIF